TMNAEFSIGAVPSPVINRAPSNIVTDEVPAWPYIWDEQAAKKMHDSTIKQRLTGLGIEVPLWLPSKHVRKKHRDTKTHRPQKRGPRFINARFCAPVCLCVSVFFIPFESSLCAHDTSSNWRSLTRLLYSRHSSGKSEAMMHSSRRDFLTGILT